MIVLIMAPEIEPFQLDLTNFEDMPAYEISLGDLGTLIEQQLAELLSVDGDKDLQSEQNAAIEEVEELAKRLFNLTEGWKNIRQS